MAIVNWARGLMYGRDGLLGLKKCTSADGNFYIVPRKALEMNRYDWVLVPGKGFDSSHWLHGVKWLPGGILTPGSVTRATAAEVAHYVEVLRTSRPGDVPGGQ